MTWFTGTMTATLAKVRRQDGWVSGLATFSHGPTFQFFLSPSGRLRLYSWRRGRPQNGTGYPCPLHRAALLAALEAAQTQQVA